MTTIDRRYSVAEGTAVKAPCRVATTANITLSGLQAIDGVTLVEHDRVLVRSQTSGVDNGIYEASSGNWLRTKDFDGAYDVVTGTLVYIASGSTYAQYEFAVSTTGDILPGTTSLSFTPTGAQSAAVSATAAAASASAAAASAATAAGYTFTTGDVKLTLKTTADSGWRMFDDGTIGDGSSGATYANVAAQALFTLMYTNFVDANAAITTSAGAATTRAAQVNAATAWANHCRIALPKVLGRALAVSGAGSGLTSRALGVTAGEETHLLTTPEIPSHTHVNTLTDPGHSHSYTRLNGALRNDGTSALTVNTAQVSDTTGTSTTGVTITNAAAGGGGAHNNMQPTSFLNIMVKL